MRKIHEILRLHYEGKLRQREIARAANVSQSTVSTYIGRAIRAQLNWPPPADWDEDRLLAALYPKRSPAAAAPSAEASRPQPDFLHIQRQLQTHAELTLELLWEEYREQHPRGYCYSRFCKLYRHWKKAQDVVMRQEHRAGERLFLDWAGAMMPIRSGSAPCSISGLRSPARCGQTVPPRLTGRGSTCRFRTRALWPRHTSDLSPKASA